MDQAHKFLKKLDAKRRASLEHILQRLHAKDFFGLDIKKLKGVSNIFRARKGNMRIIYTIGKNDSIQVLSIEFRSDKTY